MRRMLTTMIAILSVALAAGLCWGYVGAGSAIFYRWQPSPASPNYRAAALEVVDGRAVVHLVATDVEDWPGTLSVPGVHVRGHFHYRPHVDVRRATIGFEAGPTVRNATDRYYIAAAPIWCLLVPCGVAPLLWLRAWWRRRRSAGRRGFAIASGPGG